MTHISMDETWSDITRSRCEAGFLGGLVAFLPDVPDVAPLYRELL